MLGIWDPEPFYSGWAKGPLQVWRAGVTSPPMFTRITFVLCSPCGEQILEGRMDQRRDQ